MIEDILTTYASEGFVISNTFQATAADAPFGPVGWKVYIRNVRNTRTGRGDAETLEGALRAAYEAAMRGGTYERALHAPLPPKALYHPAPTLGSPESDTSEDLF